MIRYSSYGSTNYRTNPGAPTKLLCSLEIEYHELQDLRERIRMAEAAAEAILDFEVRRTDQFLARR